MFGKEAIEGEYKQLLEDRKQRILETVAKMIVQLPYPKTSFVHEMEVLKILQDNFHSYEIRNKA
jgi:hypothetical protein